MSCATSRAYSLARLMKMHPRSCLFLNHFFSAINWTEEW
ncbi:Uncharacterised protein [Serratia marcescens]|jgi:hypothetical protein|nr:hypothetical protein SME41J_06340 [Serratia marcescens]BEN34006.1 hypothetical protein SMKC041_06380 [Serratia marcescens]CAI1695036.1 Uncharacterised protein [Serratia marcescens]CVG79437.1 Uncharacterised protein [Serratia marcescens]SMP57628.1 hypothetical protein SAMN02744783_01828 [Serratia sp. CC22-02]